MAQFHDYETYQWYNHQYQDNSFSNTYNFEWRDPPNVYDQYYENQYENQGPSQIDHQFDRLKEMFNNFIVSQKEYMIETDKIRKNLRAMNAEMAMSSLRQYDELPIMPESNSREYANAITLRSDTEYQEPKMPSIEEQQPPPKETQPPSAPLNANTPASG